MNMHARRHYGKLAAMTALSFIAMYVLMYAMVDRWANVHSNLNQFYMAGLMTAPMIPIEIALMWSMFADKKLNAILIAASLVLGAGFFLAIRAQMGITDREFLASMIPHHAGAILMCREAPLEDLEIKNLCDRIVAGQQKEIDFMTRKLAELP